MSSWRVHPRVNHRLLANSSFRVDMEWSTSGPKLNDLVVSDNGGTSARYAKQTLDSSYQRYMELIASESSALLVLSMQQVSIHT